MNYIRELNAFYDWLETNPLNTSCIVLWYALMHTNNKAGWIEEFTVAVMTLELKTGLDRRTIERARNQLQQFELIKWRKRSGNQSAMYTMLTLCDNRHPSNVVQSVAQPVVHGDAQPVVQSVVQPVAITKLKETKLNKDIIPMSNPTTKTKYAEFVALADIEHEKLVKEFGETFTKRCIEVLDNYKGANGKKYKSDYRAILNWVVKRVKDEGASIRPSEREALAQQRLAKQREHEEVITYEPLDLDGEARV